MGILKANSQIVKTPSGIALELSEGFKLRIDFLGNERLRIAVVPENGFDVDRTWMIAPVDDVPWEGRDRLSMDGFDVPEIVVDGNLVTAENLRVEIEPDPMRLIVSRKMVDGWSVILEDRPHGAYQWFDRSKRLKHFQKMSEDDAHFGLGDKTGKLDRSGRRLRCLQSDALGYNAETSDPLYKHAPWVMVTGERSCTGLLYDTMAEITFDLGAEHSNYFPRYRHVEADEKGIVLYVLAGERVRDVVPKLHRLTGMPALPPIWSMGFAFTTMHHADHDQAQRVITDFAREVRARELPMSAIHLGSGYTARNGLRYVFNWNTQTFPDRTQFFADLNELGFKTCANIKPVLLNDHDSFAQAEREGWFVRRKNGSAAIEMFWGGKGASLDFTNPAAVNWWKQGVSAAVLGEGFDAVWNDNNECELWDETATLNGFNKSLPAMRARPVHALLMTRASFEATKALKPDDPVYTISRAGPIGIARYGETWSGDNRTSWHTLKWNLRQGLSMSLSGFPFVGHDIGGFAGPPPDAELLVRWFQMMALHPRCVMNSWKLDYDNIPNLPWMYEDVFEHVKAAMELRYRLLPTLYELAEKCSKTGHPIIAPSFYWFDDPACIGDSDTFMLGENILVAPVVAEGARKLPVYLPVNTSGWIDYYTDEFFAGGQTIEVDAPVRKLPIFVRGGAELKFAIAWKPNAPHEATETSVRRFASQ